MSLILQKLCKKILQEYFGNITSEVANVLLVNGTSSLKFICDSTKFPLKKVKESLCVLIKHNLLVWEELKPNISSYTLLSNRVLLLIRFPRYVLHIRDLFGEEADMVMDIILKEGQATASQIIIFATLKMLEAVDEDNKEKHITIRNTLTQLIDHHYIQKCPEGQENLKEEDLYKFSSNSIDLRLIQEEIKKHRTSIRNGFTSTSETMLKHPDFNQFWRVNYDKFHLDFRDVEIVKSLSRRIDPSAGSCFQAILKSAYSRSEPWSSSFNIVRMADIRQQQQDLPHLEQYLKIIEDNGGGCLRKVGDAGGGEYIVEIATVINTLTYSIINHIVQDRFGSKAARIFRLIRDKGMMEQDQIVEMSMIGKKEANTLTYRLLHDNFIRIHELRKSLIPTPNNKSTFFFHIDNISLVRMMIEWHYKTLYNLMEQRNLRYTQHSRLIDRKARVDTIVENLRQSGGSEEQIKEVEEMVTTSEKELIEKVIAIQDKLFESETELDESLFILQLFVYYQSNK